MAVTHRADHRYTSSDADDALRNRCFDPEPAFPLQSTRAPDAFTTFPHFATSERV
jgi:hypothetical protein